MLDAKNSMNAVMKRPLSTVQAITCSANSLAGENSTVELRARNFLTNQSDINNTGTLYTASPKTHQNRPYGALNTVDDSIARRMQILST